MFTLGERRCSFCRKSAAEVSKMVAGPRVNICDACVAIATELMEVPPPPGAPPQTRSLSQRIAAGIRRVLHVDAGHQLRDVPSR